MRCTLAMLVLLTGCSARVAPPPVDCPGPVPVPAAAPAHAARRQADQLEIRVELARERERVRGDQCAEAVGTLQNWIEEQR